MLLMSSRMSAKKEVCGVAGQKLKKTIVIEMTSNEVMKQNWRQGQLSGDTL
jgi:hypothetical protein